MKNQITITESELDEISFIIGEHSSAFKAKQELIRRKNLGENVQCYYVNKQYIIGPTLEENNNVK